MKNTYLNLDENKRNFLRMAVIEQKTYDEISKSLGFSRDQISRYWDELKEPREELSKLRQVWRSKIEKYYNSKNEEENQKPKVTKEEIKDIVIDTFDSFYNWFKSNEDHKKCYYCGISEDDIENLEKIEDKKGKQLTKRNRGKILEIERLIPDESYENIDNLVFSCYWCNNAKTDTFSAEEFKEIGKVIGEVWRRRLNQQ